MSGTATNGTDYVLSGPPGEVTIPPGASSAQVILHAIADHMPEKTESAIMTLTSGPGYKLSRNKQATINIVNAP